jgi:hypothetical protein
LPFNHRLIKEERTGLVLHNDVAYLPCPSIGKSMYFVVFIDEASRYKRIYPLKSLDANEMLKCIKTCFVDQKYDIGFIPNRIHSDRGTNYNNELIKSFLLDKSDATK